MTLAEVGKRKGARGGATPNQPPRATGSPGGWGRGRRTQGPQRLGRWGRSEPSPDGAFNRGFTLIELLVVLFLITLLLGLTLPKVSALLGDDLSTQARRLAAVLRSYADEAGASKKVFRMAIDLGEGRYAGAVLEGAEFVPARAAAIPGGNLPRGVLFEDVVTLRQGKQQEGEALIHFFPFESEAATIHLRGGERRLTLRLDPYGGVKIEEGYIDFS